MSFELLTVTYTAVVWMSNQQLVHNRMAVPSNHLWMVPETHDLEAEREERGHQQLLLYINNPK